MKFYQKSLIYKNTTLYDIDFPQKIGILRFFLRKFLLTVLHIFHRKYTPNFQKIDFSIYPNILYIYDQNFMLVPTIKLLEFSDKNWETYERLLIFWSIFWLFFLLSKVSKMKFYKKSLIYKNTTLYDIDFPQKIGILRFFLRKFLLTVFHIISWKIHPKLFNRLLSKVSQYMIYLWSKILCNNHNYCTTLIFGKNWIIAIFFKNFLIIFFIVQIFHRKYKFYKKSLIYKNTTLYDIDFPQKIGILRFFLRKFLLTVFHIIYGPFFDYFFYCPKFQKWNFIKNPWYTKIQHCTTLIFLKKLEFCDFF